MVRFIDDHRDRDGVEPICAELPIAPSTYVRHKAQHADPGRRSARGAQIVAGGLTAHARELKDELGLDHFEGRRYRGWTHHAVLAALTYTFLQHERRRGTTPLRNFPQVRNWMRKIVAVLFFLERQKWLNLLVSFLRDPPLRI